MRRYVIAALLTVALGACGGSQKLRPAAGESLPVKPAMATATPTPAELLEPSAIARPDRVSEVLRRSEEREVDRFDLPPPG